ncbi:Hypothetical protein I5071_57280 [Sandaracinus amylolyticus]|nr:Hypothetical protein I5071_57280 [Sandaracinus amylolyticus]
MADADEGDEYVELVRPATCEGIELLRIAGTVRPWDGLVETFVVTLATDRSKNNCSSFYRRGKHDGGFLSAMSPGETFQAVPHARCDWQIVQLTPAAFASLAPEAHAGKSAFASHLYDDREAYDAFRLVHRALAEGAPALASETLVRRALALLVRHDHPGASAPRTLHAPAGLQRVRDLIHDRFSEDLTVRELADASGLSREHMLRSFHRQFGLPPHQYLMHVRVSQARARLARRVAPAQAAREAGFYDSSHLHRWFVRVVGVTPSAYARAAAHR